MKYSEFAAWMEGFLDGNEGRPPTKTQWNKIQKKMKSVVADSISYYPYYHPYPYYSSTSIPCGSSTWTPSVDKWTAVDTWTGCGITTGVGTSNSLRLDNVTLS